MSNELEKVGFSPHTTQEGHYSCVKEMKELGINNGDMCKRIMTGFRADKSERNGENSFYQRWGHIQIYKY